MLEKLKSLAAQDTVFYSVLLVLIAVTSFGLGRQSVSGGGERGMVSGSVFAEYPAVIPQNQAAAAVNALPSEVSNSAVPASNSSPGTATAGSVVASKSGTKYHLPTCPGAKQIKPDNLIAFASIAEAEAAGYTPAANCKF